MTQRARAWWVVAALLPVTLVAGCRTSAIVGGTCKDGSQPSGGRCVATSSVSFELADDDAGPGPGDSR